MFSKFPREIAMPKRRLIKSQEEFIKLINLNNCKNNIYTSLYYFTQTKQEKYGEVPIYESAVVDKVFFDLDSEECYNDMQKLHKEFEENNYKHIITFSGKGFHVYLFVKALTLQNPKDAITSVQKYFIDKLKLNVDEHIIGDVARITRVPNTFNLRRRRYCILLNKDDLKLSYDEIKEKAQTQNFINNFVMGRKLFDISLYDKKIDYQPLGIDIPELVMTECNIDLEKLNLPLCLKYMLSQPHPIWRDRGFVITFFRDKGLSQKEILEIVKQFWNKDVIEHAVTSPRGDRQIYYICKDVNRYMFPTCDKLVSLNLCPKKCKQFPQAVYIK